MTIQSLSPETRALADLLNSASVGATVTFHDMSRAIGRPIASRRYLISRALILAARETGAIFGTVRSVGYQRLEAQDAHILGAHSRRRIRRTAQRASTMISAAVAKANDMPDPARRKAFAEMNALALIRHVASDREVTATHAAEPKAEPVALLMRRFARQIGAVD